MTCFSVNLNRFFFFSLKPETRNLGSKLLSNLWNYEPESATLACDSCLQGKGEMPMSRFTNARNLVSNTRHIIRILVGMRHLPNGRFWKTVRMAHQR